MKPEDKQLVFKDLCARLPYHVRCKIWLKYGTREEGPLDLQHNYGDVLRDAFFYHDKIKDIKPYLKPMSSMTEEEQEEYHSLCFEEEREEFEYGEWVTRVYYHDTIESFDWLNKNMFDYRELIPKDLALSTEEYNPYNIKAQ